MEQPYQLKKFLIVLNGGTSYAGRPHVGTHISLANNTHLLYAGSTWNLFQKGKFSGELAFGAALHSGEEDIKNNELGFGCK